jgi:hypothetical protein
VGLGFRVQGCAKRPPARAGVGVQRLRGFGFRVSGFQARICRRRAWGWRAQVDAGVDAEAGLEGEEGGRLGVRVVGIWCMEMY